MATATPSTAVASVWVMKSSFWSGWPGAGNRTAAGAFVRQRRDCA
jgi:hypothetical protein